LGAGFYVVRLVLPAANIRADPSLQSAAQAKLACGAAPVQLDAITPDPDGLFWYHLVTGGWIREDQATIYDNSADTVEPTAKCTMPTTSTQLPGFTPFVPQPTPTVPQPTPFVPRPTPFVPRPTQNCTPQLNALDSQHNANLALLAAQYQADMQAFSQTCPYLVGDARRQCDAQQAARTQQYNQDKADENSSWQAERQAIIASCR